MPPGIGGGRPLTQGTLPNLHSVRTVQGRAAGSSGTQHTAGLT